jgi:hypothetical protein
VTTVTDVLDKPALTRWKVEQVALAALENAERLVDDRDSGRGEAAVKYLTTGNTAAGTAARGSTRCSSTSCAGRPTSPSTRATSRPSTARDSGSTSTTSSRSRSRRS